MNTYIGLNRYFSLRYILYTILIFNTSLFLSSCKEIDSAEIPLDGLWKFQAGDSTEYSKFDYDDSNWDSIETGKEWEKQGFEELDGFAWYRYKVVIPSFLKNSIDTGILQLFLGKIDNNDQIFLNGTLIGENNLDLAATAPINSDFIEHPPLYTENRLYELNINDPRINWDKDNVIAVRVFDKGQGGGMSSGDPYLAISKISFKKSDTAKFEADWKFMVGDSLKYSLSDYKDNDWANIKIENEWESVGYPAYDGFAWYRNSIYIPSTLKSLKNDDQSFLRLFLGKIDDNDQIFLNGALIGENNKTVNDASSISSNFKDADPLFNEDRIYDLLISDKRIHWDEVNIIAVRVFDQGNGGGMVNGQPYINVSTLRNYLELVDNNFYKVKNNKEESIDSVIYIINNHPSLSFTGDLKYESINMETKKTLLKKQIPVTINPLDTLRVIVGLPYSEDELWLNIKLNKNDAIYLKERITVPFVLSK